MPADPLATEATSWRADDLAARIPAASLACVIDAFRRHARGDFDDRQLFEELAAGYAAGPGGGACREADEPMMAYGLLKLLLDERRGWPRWQAAAAEIDFHGDQREHAVLAIWKRLDDTREGRDFVERHYDSLTYHRHRIFEWLLGRYQVALARTVWQARPSRAIALVHGLLLGAVLAILGLRTVVERGLLDSTLVDPALVERAGVWLSPLVLVGAVYGIALGAQSLAFRRRCGSGLEALAVSVQSLIPRLGAAAVVGALALASSEELLRFVVDGSSRCRLAFLVMVGLLYVVVEMFRRLQPLPSVLRLVRLTAGVAATAFAHSLALALVVEPGLRQILGHASPFSALQRLHVAAFFFTIGLTVNLIWAEESVTQPL